MKKLILPLVAVLFLLPQYSTSQNSIKLDTNLLSVVTEIKKSAANFHLGDIETLTSFELVKEGETTGLKVQASFKQLENFDVTLYNAEGDIMFEEKFETDELNLAMGFANFPSGEYFVSIVTKEGKIVKPLK